MKLVTWRKNTWRKKTWRKKTWRKNSDLAQKSAIGRLLDCHTNLAATRAAAFKSAQMQTPTGSGGLLCW